jgi:hypothetical protein
MWLPRTVRFVAFSALLLYGLGAVVAAAPQLRTARPGADVRLSVTALSTAWDGPWETTDV